MTPQDPRTSVETNGIILSYVRRGQGPLVLFLHGFPELGRSWRHQLGPVADAGYTAVAPDLRGYGESSAPADAEHYTHLDLIGDLVGLMDALGHERAVLVGHDMGAGLAWSMAQAVPHRVRGVMALSVPAKPRGNAAPLSAAPPAMYQKWFQQPDLPERDLDAHVDTFLPGIFDRLSGKPTAGQLDALMVPDGGGFSDLFPPPESLPEWIDEAELSGYVEAFRRSGFAGGIHWYRNIDRNWRLAAPFAPWRIEVPALYVVGEHDIAYTMNRATGAIDALSVTVPGLRGMVVLPGCGHWTPQERPAEVTEALLEFLRDLE
ncbi:alpha/beta fold hydrolase [Pseudonocardia dioxanivorans]|jgi:pimeloyl-ACP methyl ester carboxylesterase|uniref:alpha/beta fold hydrolase n=1 Tax=Pseudonocardia dioxanivorans TaxID=240495 RepID=UPI000CD0BC98|nr:alpha/beta hydrolase [Pseudonocardia dioxanivorans]